MNQTTSQTITATATQWSGGWELTIDEDNVTITTRLENAEQQVRAYLDTAYPDTDHTHTPITIVIDL